MKTRYLVLTALFASLTAAGSFIRIPAPLAPITIQVFFSLLSGILLGKTYGAISQILYGILGLAGLPIFSTGGGIVYILSPSFGFILGFIGLAWLTGRLSERKQSFISMLTACLAGIVLMYIIALPYMYLILNTYLSKGLSIVYILKIGMLVYLPGDILKCLCCAYIGSKLPTSIRP